MRRTRKQPARPDRRVDWWAALHEYGKKATKQNAWKAKNLAGLFDALLEAARIDKANGSRDAADNIAIPRWAVDGTIEYMRKTMRQFTVGKGRAARWAERHRQDRIDFQRYDVVHSLHFNYGLTWEDAFTEATMKLSGLAGGSPATIQGSYKRVARALRAGEFGRYYRSDFIKIRNLDK